MSFIALLGCDGSGKSAVIEEVAERLGAEGVVVRRGHWRPKFVRGKAGAGVCSAEDPHGEPPRGVLGSILKLGWLWVNWWGGWWGGLRGVRVRGVVLFDRYHGDLLVDPRRYRYGGPMWVAKVATRWMPQPDLVLFLDADPEILLSRKQEVSLKTLEASRSKYLAMLAHQPRGFVVNAGLPLEEVVSDVLRRIGELT